LTTALGDSRPGRDILGGPGFLSEKDWLEFREIRKAEIEEILPRLGWYTRQCAGIVKAKRRVILVNFFPGGGLESAGCFDVVGAPAEPGIRRGFRLLAVVFLARAFG